MSTLVRLALGACVVCGLASTARAQGSLSRQGFGYPLGGLSSRAQAAGGAGAEFDPHSSRNPASISVGSRSGLFFQYDPEFADLNSGVGRDRTVTPRFAALGAIFPVRENVAVSISTHALLDRTWATRIRSGQRLGPDSVLFTEDNKSSGGLNETRLTVAYSAFNGKLTLGSALHAVTGENRVSLLRQFDDSLRYGTLRRSLTLAYSGSAVSAGMILQPTKWLGVAASLRRGGSLSLRVVDTLRATADVPDRLGFSVKLDAVPGVSLMAGADRTNWSSVDGLGSSRGTDVWEYALGADFLGQRNRRTLASWVYSLGFRTRELPYAAAGATVKEKFLSGGTSIPLAVGRATMDVALQRANRDAGGSVTEKAWLVSVGITVRP